MHVCVMTPSCGSCVGPADALTERERARREAKTFCARGRLRARVTTAHRASRGEGHALPCAGTGARATSCAARPGGRRRASRPCGDARGADHALALPQLKPDDRLARNADRSRWRTGDRPARRARGRCSGRWARCRRRRRKPIEPPAVPPSPPPLPDEDVLRLVNAQKWSSPTPWVIAVPVRDVVREGVGPRRGRAPDVGDSPARGWQRLEGVGGSVRLGSGPKLLARRRPARSRG